MPPKSIRVSKTCAICGLSFVVGQYEATTAKYCSNACRVASYRTHGESYAGRKSPEYTAWTNLKIRCLNSRAQNYPRYGGRGITVCDRWRDSYENFLADVGRRPSPDHSIERVDTNGHYEPGNVRWALRTEQARNRRTTRLLTLDGATRPLVEWAEVIGIPQHCLGERLRKGWDVARALTTPLGVPRGGRRK